MGIRYPTRDHTVHLIPTVMGGDRCKRGQGVKDSVWVAEQSWSGNASASL